MIFILGSANDFEGAAKAKGSVRGPQYRCLLITLVNTQIFVEDILTVKGISGAPIPKMALFLLNWY